MILNGESTLLGEVLRSGGSHFLRNPPTDKSVAGGRTTCSSYQRQLTECYHHCASCLRDRYVCDM